MTDKEIEQALKVCLETENNCCDCAYYEQGYNGVNCRNCLIRDTADYIDRLKAENAELKEDIDDYKFILDTLNQREYRKKFIKEVWDGEMGETLSTPDADFIYKLYFEERAKVKVILQSLYDCIECDIDVPLAVKMAMIRDKVVSLAKEYGVEIDE